VYEFYSSSPITGFLLAGYIGTTCINRKGYHSILLQGVCDHTKLFTDVYSYVEEVGSIHDYTMFLRSEVSEFGAENRGVCVLDHVTCVF
jgi:hypothetical protein